MNLYKIVVKIVKDQKSTKTSNKNIVIKKETKENKEINE